MDNNLTIITQDGLEELKEELNTRLTVTRKKIADEIAKARDQGDLSENAAYTSALESKQFNEARISELENIIKNSVIKKVNTKDKLSGLGEKITIKRISDNKEMVFTLVGENESDPQAGKISIKSPIGSAIFNKKVGETVKIKLPTGTDQYKIIKIN
jgi:transcription elongation factor GreA